MPCTWAPNEQIRTITSQPAVPYISLFPFYVEVMTRLQALCALCERTSCAYVDGALLTRTI